MADEQSRYLTVFENLPNPVILLDAEGRVGEMNRSAAELLRGPDGAVPARGDRLSWLPDEPAVLDGNDRPGARFPVELSCSGVTRHYYAHLARLPDGGTVVTLEETTERRRSAESLSRINECFLGFGADTRSNISSLTTLAGQLLGADVALYNRLVDEVLCSLGQWHTPPDYVPIDRPEGHVCHDVIRQAMSQPVAIRDLHRTAYAETDPHVSRYSLRTYVGQSVFCGGECVGVVCVAYHRDVEPSDDDLQTLRMVAAAISVEEERQRAEDALAWEAGVNLAVAELAHALITPGSMDGVAALVLAHAKRLTGSTYGFAGYIDDRSGSLICPTLVPDAWGELLPGGGRVVFDQAHGLWGWVLENRHSLLANDPTGDPRSSGTPNGHVPITRFLGAPALIGETLMGIVALANPAQAYTDRDLAVVERLAGLYALALQREQAEERLRVQSAALESTATAILITDRDGRITRVNPAFTRLTGYTLAEIAGENPRILSSGEHDKAFFANLWETITGGGVWQGEITNRRKDRTLYTEEMTITPVLDAGGEIGHFVSVRQDITERKLSQQELSRAKEAAEAANRAKSEFLASMSHELRTPLNAVIGFSEILADGTFGSLNERQTRYVNNILNSGRHLLQIINDILDLSKVEAGRMMLELAPFNPAAVLQDVVTIGRGLARRKGIVLHVEVDEPLPAVTADQARIRRVVWNLLSNAVKFTGEGGRVTASARIVDEEHRHLCKAPVGIELPPGRLLCISIADTGIGIAPEEHERIFGEFVQLDSSYARREQGTGLGLSLSRKLVEKHGGRIWVESEGVEGKGSTFTFFIPIDLPTCSGTL